MGALLFPRNNRHLDIFESARFEKLVELHFAEAEPMIGVKLTCALEAMAEQIQDHDPSALSQHPVSARHRALRMNRVMQSLTQNREVDRAFGDRRIFDIAESVFQVPEAVLFRELRSELNHLRRIVD